MINSKRFTKCLGNNVKILIAFSEGVPQGCAVIPFSNYSAYYLYGGSIPKPISGATNFLQWEAIKMFRNLGVQRYDFVGVRISSDLAGKQLSLMKYKQRFGGQLAQGYIWKYSLRPLSYSIYSIAVQLLRGGDIVDQER